jgi:hypothetical protein
MRSQIRRHRQGALQLPFVACSMFPAVVAARCGAFPLLLRFVCGMGVLHQTVLAMSTLFDVNLHKFFSRE